MEPNDAAVRVDSLTERVLAPFEEFSNDLDEDMIDRCLSMAIDAVTFKNLMMTYACAMKIVRTKFEILDTDLGMRARNPIRTIDTRLKSAASVVEKLGRLQLAPTPENIVENLHDVAGVRVVCSYVDDLFKLADALAAQDDVRVLQVKDYVRHPKPNGYRSLHLIVQVPLALASQAHDVEVEVQIRTIAMDFWASLEHQMKYKSDADRSRYAGELRSCAETVADADVRMMRLRRAIEDEDEPDGFDQLITHLKKLDHPFPSL